LIFDTTVYATVSVQVFFVLSGFVIAFILRNERVTPVVFGRFLLRRVIRLDPPYWVAILLSSCVIVFLAEPDRHLAAAPSWRLVLAHIFYLQDILGYGEPINHVYWTLCIEIQMYLAFCAVIGLLQAMRVPYRPVLTLGLIVALGWPAGYFPSPFRRFFLDHEYCFLAGSGAWWAIERSTPRWMAIAAAGAFLALSVSRYGDYKVWVTFSTAILLVTAGKLGTLYTWLGSRPVQFVGSISYGLYLVHDPVIALTLPAQRRLGLTSTGDALLVLLFVYLASFAVAYAVRRLVEIPSIRLSHKLKRSPTLKAKGMILPDGQSVLRPN
jgi:peptidoglycan/LPS O-acetylase OafA/YrhL